MNIAQEFERALRSTSERLGIELTEVRQYAAERMLHLSSIVDEPGYAEALEAETINVALRAAGEAVNTADEIDRELVGVIRGALAVAARALVV